MWLKICFTVKGAKVVPCNRGTWIHRCTLQKHPPPPRFRFLMVLEGLFMTPLFQIWGIVEQVNDPQPHGGYSHMLRQTEMCRNIGSVFCKKSLNMGSIFHKKIPNYGSDFQNFLGFTMWTQGNFEIWCVFVAESQEMGTFFQRNP